MRIQSFIFGIIFSSLVISARADSVITLPTVGFWTGPVGISSTQNYGYSFTVGSASLSVTSLGAFGQQFTEPIPVGLWNVSGLLLGSVTVAPATGRELYGRFEYTSLVSPVMLEANQTYILGAAYPSLHQMLWFYDPNANPANVNIYSAAVLPGDTRFNPSASLVFPSVNLGSGGSFGPNALFTVVPEPSTFKLVFVGVLIFGFLKWIRGRTVKPTSLEV